MSDGPSGGVSEGAIVGVGIDVVALDDFADIVRRRGARFTRRVFTERELDAARDDIGAFARGFAAKEAAMKALGTGWSDEVGWHDVEVDGATIRFSGGAERIARDQKVARTMVRATASAKIASAIVILST